jgi:hypothetical protein
MALALHVARLLEPLHQGRHAARGQVEELAELGRGQPAALREMRHREHLRLAQAELPAHRGTMTGGREVPTVQELADRFVAVVLGSARGAHPVPR